MGEGNVTGTHGTCTKFGMHIVDRNIPPGSVATTTAAPPISPLITTAPSSSWWTTTAFQFGEKTPATFPPRKKNVEKDEDAKEEKREDKTAATLPPRKKNEE